MGWRSEIKSRETEQPVKAGQVQGEEEVEVGVETRGLFPDRWTMEGERGE